MKTTDSKDLVKVNQILPIMQEYFGKSMNLARIKLMAYMLHALCVVQTVSLHKLASAMPTSVERDSNLRRIQRFIANYALNLDLVARMIFSLLPVKPSTGERIRTCGSSTPSKSDRRNSTTSSFCIKGSMSISPEVCLRWSAWLLYGRISLVNIKIYTLKR